MHLSVCMLPEHLHRSVCNNGSPQNHRNIPAKVVVIFMPLRYMLIDLGKQNIQAKSFTLSLMVEGAIMLTEYVLGHFV